MIHSVSVGIDFNVSDYFLHYIELPDDTPDDQIETLLEEHVAKMTVEQIIDGKEDGRVEDVYEPDSVRVADFDDSDDDAPDDTPCVECFYPTSYRNGDVCINCKQPRER